MFKINIIYIILISRSVLLTTYAQIELSDTTQDNPKEIRYKLYLNPLLNSNKLFLGQEDFKILDENYFITELKSNINDDPHNLTELKLLVNEYLKQRKTLLPNYDLGDFGKYLGYANTFAVILLAIAHISKYGFK